MPIKVTKQSVVGEVLDLDEGTAPYFIEMGMHCLGCPHSRGESLEQACAAHGADVDALVRRLNDHLSLQGR